LNLGFLEDKAKSDLILQKVKSLGDEKKGLVTDEEFIALVRDICG
jgi:hypothetical protein